jgi:hypothetical protein
MFLDIIHRLVSILKRDASEAGFCHLLHVKDPQCKLRMVC